MEAYKASFPPEFTANLKPLVPAELAHEYPDAIPNMSFKGNSLWGQFIDKHGWVNQERYDAFLAAISQAKTLTDLYEAIPMKTMQPNTSPSVFLD